ncbi:BTAD domain-containing putative transcriptional regulator [Kitasatospora sp. NPDC002227]|uniref:AfsR/SARP family transcriptional regulator n=1 Tax=Kitasatospora sp. NPDC002227 TaxID=3154773 RepID=UPI00331805E3
MHYGILGTTTATDDDGTQVPLGGARLRALLAALTLRQGRPVPADVLVDEVWGDEPPQDGAAALQTLVGRLRRTVGRGEIGSGPAGYWLTGQATDLGDFQRLAAAGRTALDAGDPALAADRLTAALALWRGPALADLPDSLGAATRLEAQRGEARRRLLAAQLALGQAAEVAAELAELCELQPLDEQLQALLIRAHREAGRPADALRQYETVRRTLAEELGTDPGPELQLLHQQLLAPPVFRGAGNGARSEEADLPDSAENQLHYPGARGAARDRKSADQLPSAHAQFPAPLGSATDRLVGNLRPRLTSFVGREEDLAGVRSALQAGRLTTLTGPGGSGKTRLSLEAAQLEQREEAWPDGVWFTELAPLDEPAAVAGAVFSALGLRETVLHSGGAVAEASRIVDPLRRIVEHCAQRRLLIVLDNCEHLIQAAAELTDQLLAECPGLTVLATSREPLGVPGEAVVPVEPLPDPVALRLLAERGAAARPGFDPATDAAACAEICRRLDGLPLAIELAAARLRGLTPRQLADRLDSRFALLTAGSRTLLPRQQTLRAVVDWSWDLLGKRERAVLGRLSLFAGGWTLEAAEQVCADGVEVRREEVADLVLSLVDKSLLVAGLAEEEPRYWMLETIHEYATERLAEVEPSGHAGETARRHTAAFRELVREAYAKLHGTEQLHWLAVLEREQDNVRAALRRAVDTGDEQEALLLLLGMDWFWSLRDYRLEARDWAELVAALGPDPFADGAPAPVPLLVDPLDVAPPLTPELLQEARRQLQIHRMIGLFSADMSMLGRTEVTELAGRITATYTRELPQGYRFPGLLRVFAAFLAGEMDRLRPLLDDAVAGCREYGKGSDLAFILQIRARMLNDWVGSSEQAAADCDEALELFTAAGDRWGMSESLAAAGENAAKCGRSQQAVDCYRRAIELAAELGSWQEIPTLQVRLGEALFELDEAEGERLIREALDGLTFKSHTHDGAAMFGRLALCALFTWRGEYPQALAQLNALQVDQRSFGPLVPDVFTGIVHSLEAWVHARAGEPELAVRQLREGRERLRTVDGMASVFAEHMTVMLVLPAVGVLTALAEHGQDRRLARRAVVLLGAQGQLHGHIGTYLERRERELASATLLGLLGGSEYAEALAEGGRLSMTEAAALLDECLD